VAGGAIGVAVAVSVQGVERVTIEGVPLEGTQALWSGEVGNRVRYATAEHLLQRQHGHPLVHTAPVGDRHPTVLMVDRAGVLPGARNGQVVAGPRILLVQGRPVSPGHLLQHSAIAVVVDATFDPQVEARRPRCTPKETAWPYPSRVIHPRMRPRRSISVTR